MWQKHPTQTAEGQRCSGSGFQKAFCAPWWMAEQRRSVPSSRCARQRLANVSVDQEATGRTLVGQPSADTPPMSPGLSFSRLHSLEKLGAKHSDASLETSQIGWHASHAPCPLPPLPSATTFPVSLCAVSRPLIPSLGQLGLGAGWVAILGRVWEEKWVSFLAEVLGRDRGPWNRQRQGKELRYISAFRRPWQECPPEELYVLPQLCCS